MKRRKNIIVRKILSLLCGILLSLSCSTTVVTQAASPSIAKTTGKCLSLLNSYDTNHNGIMDYGAEYVSVLNNMITSVSEYVFSCPVLTYFDLVNKTNPYTRQYNRMSCLCSKYGNDTMCCDGNQTQVVFIPQNDTIGSSTSTTNSSLSAALFFSSIIQHQEAFYVNNDEYAKRLCQILWKITSDHCNTTTAAGSTNNDGDTTTTTTTNEQNIDTATNNDNTTATTNSPYTDSNSDNNYHPTTGDDVNKGDNSNHPDQFASSSNQNKTSTSSTTDTLDPRDSILLHIVLPILCILLVILCIVSCLTSKEKDNDNGSVSSNSSKSKMGCLHRMISNIQTRYYAYMDHRRQYFVHHHPTTTTPDKLLRDFHTNSHNSGDNHYNPGKLLRDFNYTDPNKGNGDNSNNMTGSTSSSSSSSSLEDTALPECGDIEKGISTTTCHYDENNNHDHNTVVASDTIETDQDGTNESLHLNQQQSLQQPSPQHRMSALLDRLGLITNHQEHDPKGPANSEIENPNSRNVVYDLITTETATAASGSPCMVPSASPYNEERYHHHRDRSTFSTNSNHSECCYDANDDNMSTYSSISALSIMTPRITNTVSSLVRTRQSHRCELYSDDEDYHHQLALVNRHKSKDRVTDHSHDMENNPGLPMASQCCDDPTVYDKVWESLISDEQKEEAWMEFMEQSLFYQNSDDYYTMTWNNTAAAKNATTATSDLATQSSSPVAAAKPTSPEQSIDDDSFDCIPHDDHMIPNIIPTRRESSLSSRSYYSIAEPVPTKRKARKDSHPQRSSSLADSKKTTTMIMKEEGESIPNSKLRARLQTMPSSLLDNTTKRIIKCNNGIKKERANQQYFPDVMTTTITNHSSDSPSSIHGDDDDNNNNNVTLYDEQNYIVFMEELSVIDHHEEKNDIHDDETYII